MASASKPDWPTRLVGRAKGQRKGVAHGAEARPYRGAARCASSRQLTEKVCGPEPERIRHTCTQARVHVVNYNQFDLHRITTVEGSLRVQRVALAVDPQNPCLASLPFSWVRFSDPRNEARLITSRSSGCRQAPNAVGRGIPTNAGRVKVACAALSYSGIDLSTTRASQLAPRGALASLKSYRGW